MSILVSTGLVGAVVHYCCLCMVMVSNLVMFAMQENIEQWYAIQFCVKLNICHRDICFINQSLWRCHSIENYATLSRTMPLYRELWFFFKLHKAFKEGQENVEDYPRSGRPISSTNDQNVEVVRAL